MSDSTSESPRIPREFQSIDSLAEALKLLKEGCKTLSSAMIWTRDQEQVVNSHLSVYSEATETFYCWAPKELNRTSFTDEVAKSPQNDCYFSVSLFRANIFFRAIFLGFDTAGLHFKFPTKIYKVQRRNDVRLPLLDNMAIRMECKDPLFPEQKITKKVLDISAGGMAFVIDEADTSLFPVGLTLEDVSFQVGIRRFTTRAEITNSRKLKDERNKGSFAVGVKFKDLRPGDVQHIASYVFEESRKYFMRFV